MAEIGNVTFRVDAVITDEQYREAMGAVRAANERMDLLKAENAKLRELVEDMLDYIEIREAFGRPPTSERCKEFAQRAGELGIEVDG